MAEGTQKITLDQLKNVTPKDWQMFALFCADEGDYTAARLGAGFAAGSQRRCDALDLIAVQLR